MQIDKENCIIKGVDIPFIDLVILLIKLAFASIPAMFVIYFVFMLFGAFFDGIFQMAFFHP